jgi:hypothetical protein
MLNTDTIFLFLFVLSVLNILKLTFAFIGALLQNPPKKLVLSNRELIFFYITLSYIITFLIQN